MLISGTREFSLDQIRNAGQHLAKHPPKPGTPLLGALCEAMDKESQWRQRQRNRSEGEFVVPFILGAREEDVQSYRKPAGYQWSTEELATIYAELGLRAPDSLARRAADDLAEPLDVGKFGPPPDPNDHTIPLPERKAQLKAQMAEKLRLLAKSKAGPPYVPGMASIGSIERREAGEGE